MNLQGGMLMYCTAVVPHTYEGKDGISTSMRGTSGMITQTAENLNT